MHGMLKITTGEEWPESWKKTEEGSQDFYVFFFSSKLEASYAKPKVNLENVDFARTTEIDIAGW